MMRKKGVNYWIRVICVCERKLVFSKSVAHVCVLGVN